MKSGLPWNLKGVDAETRDAILEAARLSGVPVAEWLKQVLGDKYADPAPEQQKSDEEAAAGDLARSMQALTGRIAAMSETSRAAISALPRRLDAIERSVARLSSAPRGASERPRLFQEVTTMVRDLAREVDNADEQARSMVEGLRGRAAAPPPRAADTARVSEAISELDRRIAAMQQRIAEPPPEAPRALTLDDIRARLNTLLAEPSAPAIRPAPPAPVKAPPPPPTAAIDAALQTLEERIDSARARLDSRPAVEAQPQPPAPPAATVEHIERIEQRLAEIGERLAQSEAARLKPKKEADIASAIREISVHQRAIDDRAETLAMRRDQKALAAAMGALRTDLGALSEQVSAISRIGAEGHGAVFDVAQRIDALAAERPLDRDLLTTIRGDLENLRGMIEGGARQGALEGLHEGIAVQFDDLKRTLPDRDRLDALSAEVASLRSALEADDSPRAVQRLEMKVAELGRAIEAAVSIRRADPAVERLEVRLEDIVGRIESLRDTSAHVAAIETVEQRLDGRLTEIAERLGNFLDPAPQAAAIRTAEQRLDERLTEITERLRNFDPAPQAAVLRVIGQRLDGQLNDIAGRLNGLIETAPQTIDMEAAQQRFQDSIEQIADRLGGAVEEATRPQAAALETVQRTLEGRLEEIVGRLGGLSDNSQERAAIEHVHERLQAITERIDRLNASQKEPSVALDVIKAEIGALRKDVAGTQVPPSQIAAIRSEIGALRTEVAGNHVPVTEIEGIRRQIGALRKEVTGNQILPTEIEGMRRQIGTMREEIAGSKVPLSEIAAIRRDLGTLRDQVTSHEPVLAPLPNTEHLEAQIRDLAAQLETVAGARDDGPALATLEAQIARLAGELEQNKPQISALHQVEETLDRVQAALADTAQESIATARAEARKAVSELSEMVAGNDTDADLIRGLMRDLDGLKTATGSTQDTQDTTRARLESVSEAMNQVVERLSRLESDVTQRAVSPAPPEPVSTPTHGELDRAWGVALRGQAVDAAPEPVAMAPTAAFVPAMPVVQIDQKAAARRADFIAAARRAAQAVASEAASLQGPADAAAKAGDGEERKPGAFARISQAIRSRKRPLLLAAAAIVLAIGAMQLYGKFAPAIEHVAAGISARPAVVVAADAPKTVRQILDATAPASPPAAATEALIPPSANPTPQVTFAQPDAAAAPLAGVSPAPEATGFSGASTAAADPAAPVMLASADAKADAGVQGTSTPATVGGLDPALGPPKLLAAANAGDPGAEFEIAARYAEGAHVPADLSKAAVWYAKAADGGIAVAQYRLASLYERGQGVTKDLTTAVNWYQRASDQGNINAMHNLAVLLSEGVDGVPDHDKALQWFIAAGNYGVRDSQYNLGVIYARGLGATQDLVESYKWFAIAASQGDTDASARRDEVAKAMSPADLAKARASVSAWHAKAPLVEANAVAAPKGNWDDGAPSISVADQQALVAKIQTLLADAGYDPGPADGKIGQKTVDAVKAYQQKAGVPVTGRIDKTLVASLSENQT
ncbi:MAG TPA: peptidoglycan-binding protein [Bauldia sp.]